MTIHMITEKTKNNLIKLAIIAAAIAVFLMMSRCTSESQDPTPAKPAVKESKDQITLSVRVVSGECFQGVNLNAFVDQDDVYEGAAALTCDVTTLKANGLKSMQMIEVNIYPNVSDAALVKAVKAATFEYTFTQDGVSETLIGNCGCTADGSVKYFVK